MDQKMKNVAQRINKLIGVNYKSKDCLGKLLLKAKLIWKSNIGRQKQKSFDELLTSNKSWEIDAGRARTGELSCYGTSSLMRGDNMLLGLVGGGHHGSSVISEKIQDRDCSIVIAVSEIIQES